MSEHAEPSKQPSRTTAPKPAHTPSRPAPQALSGDSIGRPRLKSLTPALMMTLQRTHGNQFVQRVVAQARQSQVQSERHVPEVSITNTPPPLRVQRLTEDEVSDHFILIEDMPEGTIAALAELTEAWQSQGIRVAREDFANNLLKEVAYKIDLGEISAPQSVDEWVTLVRDRLPTTLPEEPEKKQEQRREEDVYDEYLSDEDEYGEYDEYSSDLQSSGNQQEEPASSDEYGGFGNLVNKKAEDLNLGISFKNARAGPDARREVERNQQKLKMVSKALFDTWNLDNRLEELINSDNIEELITAVMQQKTVTFTDVLNLIVDTVFQNGENNDQSPVQSKDLQDRINEIRESGMDAIEKLTEIAHLLWGSFDWYSKRPHDDDAGQQDNFILWLTDSTGQIPEPNGADKMNCWEGVILVLYKAGRVSKETLQYFYEKSDADSAGAGVAYQLLHSQDQTVMYTHEDYKEERPAAGDIVSVWAGEVNNGLPEHVMLSLGKDGKGNDKVLSLWTFSTGGMMGVTTIQDIVDEAFFNVTNCIITFNTPALEL